MASRHGTKAGRPTRPWSYSTGERGKTRVRAFDRGPRGLYVEFYEHTATGRQKVRLALGTTDREAAKAKADELAAAFRTRERSKPAALTLGALFELYEREVTCRKGATTQKHDRRCIEMFTRYFGASRKVKTLSRLEWDRFIAERRSGRIAPLKAPKRRPVRDRVIGFDLAFLMACLNWATLAGDGHGGALLERNPLKGLPVPKEASPKRPALTEAQYLAVRKAAAACAQPWVELFVVLAHETGHRAGSIRQLRWSDIDLTRRTIRWRAEIDKIRFAHDTPLSDGAVRALEAARRAQPTIGDALLFPSRENPAEPYSGHAVFNLWKRIAKKAGLPEGQRLGWHSLRRQFATELKAVNLKDLCSLGGWKNPQTLLTCYVQPDEATQRDALAARQPVRVAKQHNRPVRGFRRRIDTTNGHQRCGARKQKPRSVV